MIDNFELIKDFIKSEKLLDNPDEFLFLQLICRKKDFSEGQERYGKNNNHRLIKAYYIYNLEQLDKYKEEITKLCIFFNARAGINLNRRNQKKVALKVLEMLAMAMRKDDFNTISKIYNSACGKESSQDKFWLIDLDKEDLVNLESIKKSIESCRPNENTKILVEIPSKSGLHLITRKFDRQQFSRNFPQIEIHTNNPVNLYIP